MNILIVEDNENIASSLVDLFTENKHLVTVVHNGRDGIDYGMDSAYDLILMDVMMPKVDGITAVKALRKNGISTPIIMLTAKSGEDEKIIGLDCGADDYMTKPFSTKELMARVRALSRRYPEIAVDTIKVADLTLDLSASELRCGEKQTGLSYREFEVLGLLMRNKGMIFSKEDIIIKIWGYDSVVDENNVEAYISFLRKKLKFLDASVSIRTVRMIGYVLEVKR